MTETTKPILNKTLALSTAAALVVGASGGALLAPSHDAGTIADQNQTITDLAAQLNVLNATVASTASEAKNLSDAKAALQAELEAKTVSVTDLQAQVTKLQDDIKAAQLAVAKEDAAKELAAARDKTTYLFDDIVIGGTISKTLDNTQLPKLFDDKIYYDGESYDAKESIIVSNGVEVVSAATDGDFNDGLAVGFATPGAVLYQLELTDPIQKVTDEDIEVPFLGGQLTIIDVNAAQHEIDVLRSNKLDMSVGQVIKVAGKDVTLVSVSDNKALIKVGDATDTVSELASKRIGGLQVYVKSVFNADTGTDYALVYVGTDVKETIKAGDSYNDNDSFEWIVDFNGAGELTKLGVKYVDTETYADENVLFEGQSLSLPNGFVKLTNEGFSETYKTVALDVTVHSSNIEFKANDDKAILVNGEKVDNGKFTFDGTQVTYKTDGDEFTAPIGNVSIEIDDRVVTLASTGTIVSLSNGMQFTYNLTSKDITSVIADSKNLESKDAAYRTLFGDVVAGDIENKADDGSLSLHLVSEQVKVNIRVQ